MSQARPKISIIGVSGRLGQAIARMILTHEECELVGGLVKADSACRDSDIGQMVGIGLKGVQTQCDLMKAVNGAEIIIDVSTPKLCVDTAQRLSEIGGYAYVTGTTGLDDLAQEKIENAANKMPILQAGNFSLGMAVVERLVSQAAKSLDPDQFDLEIIETHHKHKKDSPSGTALILGKLASKARKTGSIGFTSVRGGGVIGEHCARFMSMQEEISINHRAFDRDVFAHGALTAAQWLKGKPAGLYTMQDVIETG